MDIQKMRHELRHGTSPYLRESRWVMGLSAIGLVDFAAIALYQSGVFKRLPDFPGKIFDTNKVNASHKAYAMGAPDGTTGALLYAATMVLATAGGTPKSGRHPFLDILLGGAVMAGVGAALQYTYDMIKNQEKACPYCIVGGLAHMAMIPFALPRALRAFKLLRTKWVKTPIHGSLEEVKWGRRPSKRWLETAVS